MTSEELKQAFDRWGITAAQAAKVLCLHSNRLSEYLGDVTRIPCAIEFSVESLDMLDSETRNTLFQKRLARKTHGAS